jgi:hypothetical protein
MIRFWWFMALLEDSFFWIDSTQFSIFQAIPINNRWRSDADRRYDCIVLFDVVPVGRPQRDRPRAHR